MDTRQPQTNHTILRRWAAALFDYLESTRRRRANAREIGGLSDHMLRDIGFDPDEVRSAMAGNRPARLAAPGRRRTARAENAGIAAEEPDTVTIPQCCCGAGCGA